MLGIKQSRNHVTNQIIGQVKIHQTTRVSQLKFTGHCIRMPTDEPANRYVIYESSIRAISSTRSTKNDLNQSNFVENSTNWRESTWGQRDKKDGGIKIWVEPTLFKVSKKKKAPDTSSKPARWWWKWLILNLS